MTWYEILGVSAGTGIVGWLITLFSIKAKVRKEGASADKAVVEVKTAEIENAALEDGRWKTHLEEINKLNEERQAFANEKIKYQEDIAEKATKQAAEYRLDVETLKTQYKDLETNQKLIVKQVGGLKEEIETYKEKVKKRDWHINQALECALPASPKNCPVLASVATSISNKDARLRMKEACEKNCEEKPTVIP